jgi:8-oxo-dGTP pyrophosphatase MutT (NUDIX family)
MNRFDRDIDQIRKSILKGLPGFNAQQKLAPRHRNVSTIDYLQRHPDFKTASVAVMIYPKSEESHIVLIERSDFGNHAGQISLPGGRKELDETKLQAAMREAFEETGVALTMENCIGELSEIYIPLSNFLVHPFVFFLSQPPAFKTGNREVKRIIELPLHDFLREGTVQWNTFINSGSTPVHAPSYEIQDMKIWGATAMIISEFISLLN